MPSNHLIFCCCLFLLPSIFPSIRVFSNQSALHNRWPKYRGFGFSISLSNSGLVFLRIDWFDLLTVQGTLKSSPAPQFKSINSSALIQFSSVSQSCPTLCDTMNRSTPGLPVHHQLPEFTQTHFHRVSDAIQPSHHLSSPSPPALKSLSASESFPMSQLFT